MMIRLATPEDIPAIVHLEKQTPEVAHWSEQAYEAAFAPDTPERLLLVTELEGKVQAFLIARFSIADCELENIVVAVPARNRGIGSQLLRSLSAAARERGRKKILLEVRESNAAARSLYGSFGFEETGRRKNYYTSPPEDAVLYTLDI
jgi:[ribosomal protein S18]-alanine N-acetyltransferase